MKNYLLYFIAAVFSFFFGLFLLDQVILPQIAGGQKLVKVPVLQNSELEKARSLCTENNLELVVRGETNNSEVPADHILIQEPESGTEVKEGRKVYVLVSLGPEIITVPYVRGLTSRQARLLIERNRLELMEVVTRPSDEVGENRVISIEPEAGTTLSAGSKVRLVVAEAAPRVLVPSIIDMNLEEATNALKEIGLEVGEVQYQFNRNVVDGHVLDQTPLENAKVRKGTKVNLILASSLR